METGSQIPNYQRGKLGHGILTIYCEDVLRYPNTPL